MATQYTYPEPEPKFWDKEAKCIYHGLKRCTDPVSLVSLAGTYRWVFLSQTSWGSIEFRYESDPEVVKKKYPGFPGFFKIRFPEDLKPSLENLEGEFRFWDIKGAFVGVTPHEKKNGKVLENSWDINEMKWDPDYCEDTYDITTGHAVEVCNMVDDNGNRLVTLVWDQGWSGCCPNYGEWIGKKQTDDKALVGLTDAERERLGMYLTEDEVKARAATPKTKNAAKDTDNKRKADDSDGGRDVKRRLEVDGDGERDVKRKRED